MRIFKHKRKMLTDCPELMMQWDYGKNEYLSPESLTAGSGCIVWWLCEKAHSWQTSVNHRHRGSGCPICKNRIVVKGVNDLNTVNPILAAEWNYEKNAPLAPEDVPNGTHRKVWWRCLHGHEWEAEIISRVYGNGCPCCSGMLVVKGVTDLETLRPDLAAQFDTVKNKGVLPSEICNSSNKKVWWTCEKGHSWLAGANTRQKSGCPVCSGKVALPGYNDLLALDPELAKQWDYTNNIKPALPSEITLGSGRCVWWRCDKGHSYEARIADRRSGHGCPYCSGRRAIPGETDFGTIKPKLLAEWDYGKNKKHKPEHLRPQSNEKVWWVCKCGYSWKAPVYRRFNGSGCPSCAGDVIIKGKNDLLSQYPHIAKQWDYSKNPQPPDEVFAHSNKYAWWICRKGHSWDALINNRTGKGRGCPYCFGYLVIPGETDLFTRCPQLVEEWDYTQNTLDIHSTGEYTHDKAWWICKRDHSWLASIKSRRDGRGCPYCAGKRAIPGETDLLTVAPHLAKEWDYEQNTLNITEVTLKSNEKVWWICRHGHKWKTQIYNRAIGCGCPYCSGQRAIPGETDLLTLAPHLANEWDYEQNSLSISCLTLKSNHKVWWMCKHGHRWSATVASRTEGTGCPNCAGRIIYKPKNVKG